MEPEIWFEKWLWSYMPCHWKGWAFLFVLVALAFTTIGIIHAVCAYFGNKNADLFDFGALVVIVIFGSRIPERHSHKRK